MRIARCVWWLVAALLSLHRPGWSQTLNGASFALRSNGSAASTTWILNSNGYVGTYVSLASPGTVSFAVQALGNATSGPAPHMNIVVNDSKVGWDVTPSAGTYSQSLFLPAGTHFIRTELNNYTPGSNATLQIQKMTVSGAALANASTDANALAAANTYIDNYRKTTATIALSGPGGVPLLPGTTLTAVLKRNAFSFGTAVPGTGADVGNFISPGGQNYANFSPRLLQNFNSVVPENAGKWTSNESTRDSVSMTGVDTILSYANTNHLRVRMHNLIWGSSNPSWVGSLLTSAGTSQAARDDLRGEISERIAYYLNSTRAPQYGDVDIYNESYHTPQYTNVYGISGVAGIYNEAAQAIANANSNAKTFVNEYNVFQWTDAYSNWYKDHIDSIRAAGGNVGGIGLQYYVATNQNADTNSPHSPARMQQILQNLSVSGLPLALTEWGLGSGGTGTQAQSTDTTRQANILEESLRLMYGTPQATGFNMWGFWEGAMWDQATYGALYDINWNIRPTGTRWQSLMSQWNTGGGSFTIDSSGAIVLNGALGDYNIGNQTAYSNLTTVKGTNQYQLTLSTPPQWSRWNISTNGEWNTASNWLAGGVPNAVGQTAYLGTALATKSLNLATNITLGQLAFNGTFSYTLGGPGAIHFDGPAGVTSLYVVNGNHTISNSIVLHDPLTITVVQPTSTLNLTGSISAGAGMNITKAGDGAVQMEALRADAVNILAGTIRIRSKLTNNDPAGAGSISALSVTAGKLDLTNNSLAIHYSGASPIGAIRDLLRSGFNNGGWNGNGIVTSLADATHGIGSADDSSTVSLKYTFFADANLDGQVNAADLGALASHWQQSSQTWADGDFNYSGTVNIADLYLLAINWQAGVGAPLGTSLDAVLTSLGLPSVTVPEPHAWLLASAAGVLLRRRRPPQPQLGTFDLS